MPRIIISDKIMDWLERKQGFRTIGHFFFPFIIMRSKPNDEKGLASWDSVLNHEKIHFRQSIELLVVGFLIIYGGHYLFGRIQGLNHYEAYRNVIFEKEARKHQRDQHYLKKRKWCNWAIEKYS